MPAEQVVGDKLVELFVNSRYLLEELLGCILRRTYGCRRLSWFRQMQSIQLCQSDTILPIYNYPIGLKRIQECAAYRGADDTLTERG